jgi:cyclopropane-fatty-acyl-phospholipid synthase
MSITSIAVTLIERGLVPDWITRLGIRHLLGSRLADLRSEDTEHAAHLTQEFVQSIQHEQLALLPEKANEQHYEVPAEFFAKCLGEHRKYSSCYWPVGASTLAQAERAALSLTCARAGLADGQHILELGCGWGSLSLWMAAAYPASQITVLSNSNSQREYIEEQARQRGLPNLAVITRDFNDFDTDDRFDRIVSVEMFEHLRNWPAAFKNVSKWLKPDGKFFMHVFSHRGAPYPFIERDASDWMSKYFFSGGMMPSDDLALHCQDHLLVADHWRWAGTHYSKTSEAWLSNMDAAKTELFPLFKSTYGDGASVWWVRWRLFFMAVAELFAYENGQQWFVSQYLFTKRLER